MAANDTLEKFEEELLAFVNNHPYITNRCEEPQLEQGSAELIKLTICTPEGPYKSIRIKMEYLGYNGH